jgi:site-specific DNA recombinase
MLSRLDEVDVIVTWRLDRLVRSVSGFAKLVDQLEDNGVLLATTDGAVDMTTASGRAFAQMRSVFAELEAGTTSERARQMHAYKRERGEWVGRTPFGFRMNGGKTIEPDPETFPILEDAARRYVAGESLRSIAADVGILHANLAKRLRSDHTLEALPPALSAALSKTLAERGRSGTRAMASLLGGIARCGVCGAGLSVVGQSVRDGRSPRGAYGCREARHVNVSRPWLDEHVSAAVIDAIDTGALLRRLAKRRRPRAQASAEIEARLELLEVDHYERGMVARDNYLRRREALLRRLGEAREAEQDAGVDLPRELALHLRERWQDLTTGERRRIVSAVLERVEVARASGHGRIDPDRIRLVWRG